MSIQVSGVDHHLCYLTATFCQFQKDAPKHAQLAPTDEAVVDCLVWSGAWRNIAPPQHPFGAVNESANCRSGKLINGSRALESEEKLRHLHFVIPIRHPSTVLDPTAQYFMLHETIRSIANQLEHNWTGWIVANPDQRLPDIPAKFNVLNVDISVEATLLTAQTREQHWSAFRLDKGRRVWEAVSLFKKDDMFMVVDDDDLVSRRLSKFISSADVQSGFYVDHGYSWQGGDNPLEPIKNFHRLCGTSLIIRAGYSLSHATSVRAGHESVISELGSHRLIVDRAIREGVPLKPLPFPGAVYRRLSPNSDSTHTANRLPSELVNKPQSSLISAVQRGHNTFKKSLLSNFQRALNRTQVRSSVNFRHEFFGE